MLSSIGGSDLNWSSAMHCIGSSGVTSGLYSPITSLPANVKGSGNAACLPHLTLTRGPAVVSNHNWSPDPGLGTDF